MASHFMQIACLQFLFFTFILSRKYVCDNTTRPPTDLSCAWVNFSNPDILNLRPCKDKNKICEITFGGEVNNCSDNYTNATLYPGENCTQDIQCYSGHCQNGMCLSNGQGLNKPCLEDSDCDTGYSCIKDASNPNPFCYNLLLTGQKGCSSTLLKYGKKCMPNLICDGDSCEEIGSKKKGDKVKAPFECYSLFAHYNQSQDTYYCVDGPKLVSSSASVPSVCIDNCKYTYKSPQKIDQTIIKPCSFSWNESYSKVCNPGIGDLSTLAKQFFAYTKLPSKCHVSRGLFCNTTRNETELTIYYKGLVAYKRLTQYSDVYKNEYCVQQMINSDYYDATNHLPSYSKGLGILLGFILLIFIFIA